MKKRGRKTRWKASGTQWASVSGITVHNNVPLAALTEGEINRAVSHPTADTVQLDDLGTILDPFFSCDWKT